MKLLWIVLCCLFCNFFFSPCLLAEKNIKFERLTIEHGLSQNTVYAILQDSKGFLWFGTEGGLNRYDGYTFEEYRYNPDTHDSLSNNRAQVLYEDNSGIIWIGTHGGGLNKFDRKKETFTRFTHKPSNPNSLSNDIVWAIGGGKGGVLWIGTEDGLNRFDPETGQFTRWFNEEGNPDSLSHNCIRAVVEDNSGVVWIGTTGGGLNKFVPGKINGGTGMGDKFFHYKNDPANPDSLSHNDVHALHMDPSGVFWIGTENGLNSFDHKKGLFNNPSKKREDLFNIGKRITFLTGEAKSSVLWIGTYGGGLYRFERETEKLTHFRHNPANPTSLSNNSVQSIFEDNAGILWVGTDSGLNKFDRKKQEFGHWCVEPDNPDSLSNNSIWSIYKDHEGILWIGTENGLEQLDRKNNKCTHIKIENDIGTSGSRKVLWIYEDRTGVLWFSISEQGLYRFDRKERTARHVRHDPSNPTGSISKSIHTIYEDTEGILWFGTSEGLNRFERKSGALTCFKNVPGKTATLSNNYVITIYEDRSQVLWIGTRGGLNRFHRESETFTHWKREPDNPNGPSHDKISSIWEDASGSLWIGTWGGGLNKFDRKNGTFKYYMEKDGLPNESIYGILGDEEGNLWLSTNRGISKFDPKSENFKNYNSRDGLQSNEFNATAYSKSADGEMFFGGINGFNAFYPNEIRDNPHVPPIVITAFQIMNEPVEIGGDSPLKQAINETKEITLSYRDYFFSFEFSALDFSNPDKNKYVYKMEGFNKEWIHTGAKRRFATYTNLDPGEYVFHVKGSNNDGVWNNEGTSIKIIITPPLWKTLWFRILAILSFSVFSYWLIGFIKKYVALAGFWKKEKYIGKFKLIGKIGSGGMGTIYRAKDTTQKIGTVALKVLKDELYIDENYRKRFKQEAAIIDQLDHPNIVKVIERGQFEQKLFIAMELLRGQTLSTKIAQQDEIDLMEVIDIIYQVTDALVKIHSKYIVHRDLKPDNIMLIEHKGNCNFVKLLDFGLAKTEHQTRITQTGTVLGTLNYMAPEQIADGRYSYASDVYSLGVIFYETLTKEIPFPGDNVTDIMRQILNDAPAEPILRRPDLTPGLNSLVLRMIEKHPGSRPLAKEVFDEIKGFRLMQTQYINED